jgi:hypothetical protein
MSFGYIGDTSTSVKQQVKNKGILTTQESFDLERQGFLGGSLELIESQTVSGVSQVDFTNIKEGKYKTHLLVVSATPSIDTQVYLRLSNDAGSSFVSASGSYQYVFTINDEGNTAGDTKSDSSTQIYLNYGGGNSANEEHSAYYYFHSLGDSTLFSLVTSKAVNASSTGTTHSFMSAGVYKTKEVVNAIRVFFQYGNTTGKYDLFGIKEI